MIKRNKYTLLIVVLVVGLLIAGAVFMWMFRKAPESMQSQKAEFETESVALVKAFEEDETASNTKFLGKVIVVSGTIESFAADTKEKKVSVTLKNTGDMSGVICEFAEGSIDAKLLQTGKVIRIKGICNGYLMDVVLTKCSVEE